MNSLAKTIGTAALSSALVAGAMSITVLRAKPAPVTSNATAVVQEAPEKVVVEREVVVHERHENAALEATQPKPQHAETADAPEAPRTEADLAAAHETSFQEDRPATSASRNLEVTLRNALRDPSITGAKLNALECRATQCRAEMTFDDIDASREAIQKLFANQDAKVPMAGSAPVQRKDDDGRVSMTLYLRPATEETEPTNG